MINLSYLISTKNRLPYLKITLAHLIQNCLPDEEIVVVDAHSSDGTGEYLKALLKEGKIHQLLIEADKNQAHGWNKAMMMAKGILLKKIIDDDVFCFEAIRKCKNQLLAHAEIDFCISNALSVNLSSPALIEQSSRFEQFSAWKNGSTKSFSFSDVYLMIRKSALAYTGLYNTQFVMLDWEFALRISYLKCNIAYYTGYMAMGVGTPSNITSLTSKDTLKNEGKIGAFLYQYEGDSNDISLWSKTKIFAGKLLKKDSKNTRLRDQTSDLDLQTLYNHFYQVINQKETTADATFY